MRHLIDLNSGKLLPVQGHSTTVLRENLRMLLAVPVWLDIEAANCTLVSATSIDRALADRVEDVKCHAFLLFDELTG